MEPTIKYVPKEEMPEKALGWWYPTHLILIRNDLPKSAENYVLSHELYHDNDAKFNESSVLVREMKAHFHAFIRHPIGFLRCCYIKSSELGISGLISYYRMR